MAEVAAFLGPGALLAKVDRLGSICTPRFLCQSTCYAALQPTWRTKGDVAVDSRTSPSMVKVHLKRSKCDQFGRGVDVVVGRTDTRICPVAAVVSYIARRQICRGHSSSTHTGAQSQSHGSYSKYGPPWLALVCRRESTRGIVSVSGQPRPQPWQV